MASFTRSFKLLLVVGLITGLHVSLYSVSPYPAAARPRSWRTVFQSWLNRKDPGKKGEGGTRDGACLITPRRDQPLWNTRPVFVWQGDRRIMAVRQASKDGILFKQTASPGKERLQRLRYDGEPLQAGKTYEWLFFITPSLPLQIKPIPFQIMEDRDRAPITADLQALEQRLTAQNASREEIARQRADYFAQRQLWADMLQEVYGIDEPSEELKLELNTLLKNACS